MPGATLLEFVENDAPSQPSRTAASLQQLRSPRL